MKKKNLLFAFIILISSLSICAGIHAEETGALIAEEPLSDTQTNIEDELKVDDGDSLEIVTEEESLVPAQADTEEEKVPSLDELAEGTVHEVVAGDTLYDIAIKYKTTVENLKTVNTLKKDMIFPGMKLKISQGIFEIKVDKSDNILTLYFNDKLIKEYSVSTGKDSSTPVGEFKIINKIENPTWYKAGAIVPPDSPDNILGPRWLGFDKPGYGIHGTTMPETIGEQASAGCVRMKNEDVEDLFAIVPVGTKVSVAE